MAKYTCPRFEVGLSLENLEGGIMLGSILSGILGSVGSGLSGILGSVSSGLGNIFGLL